MESDSNLRSWLELPVLYCHHLLLMLNCHMKDVYVPCRNYMNDSLRTNLFVRFPPETIACACIFLAARELKVCVFI